VIISPNTVSRNILGRDSIEESLIESIPSADTNTDSDSDTIDTGIDTGVDACSIVDRPTFVRYQLYSNTAIDNKLQTRAIKV
jgi:hypothetical protein